MPFIEKKNGQWITGMSGQDKIPASMGNFLVDPDFCIQLLYKQLPSKIYQAGFESCQLKSKQVGNNFFNFENECDQKR